MKLCALVAARNESWCIGLSLRVALKWCDEAVVLLHCCTDNTADIVADIAEEYPGRVHILVDKDPEWAEMSQRQRMLEEARRHGATHLAVVDADEVLTGNLLPTIRDQVAQLPAGGYMHCGMLSMWRSLTKYRVDPCVWSNRWDLMLAFRDKSGLRWEKTNGYDHHHREPHGSRLSYRLYGHPGGVMHLQWCSWRRLVAKHARYRCMERVKYPNKPISEIERQYSLATDERGLKVADTPGAWWEPYQDYLRFVNLDAEPWHEGECKRLITEHGIERFKGLNLFGLEALCEQANYVSA